MTHNLETFFLGQWFQPNFRVADNTLEISIRCALMYEYWVWPSGGHIPRCCGPLQMRCDGLISNSLVPVVLPQTAT
jgi:hypothetical protein